MIKKIIFYGIYTIIFSFLVFTLGSRLFGIRYYVVISDSMYPTIPKNTLVYVKLLDNDDKLAVDEVIAINTGDVPLMHRIIEVNGDSITTHGDNNKAGVNETITRQQVIGKVVFYIPVVGVIFRSIYPLVIIGLIIIGLIVGERLVKEIRKK